MSARLLLIVEDHEEFGTLIRQLLNGDEFQVVGVASDGESAIEAVLALHPEVVLLDVQLPGIDGFEVAERLARSEHPPAVVLTSTRDASDFGPRLTDAPVRGFVPKHELSATTVAAILKGR